MSNTSIAVKVLGDAASLENALAKMRASLQLTEDAIKGKAQLVVEKSTVERENLQKLAVEYQALADAAEKGSAQQVAASEQAERALRKLGLTAEQIAAQSKAAGVEAAAGWKSMSESLTAAGASISGVGKTLTSKVTLPIAAVGAVAEKFGLDFNHQMMLVQTSAGGSAGDVQVLSKQVLNLARTSKDAVEGPTQLAQAMYHLKSLGLDNATALGVLKQAMRGALAGSADLEATTNALGGAVRTNIKGTENYGHAMAVLVATVGAGNMRMDDLTAALGTGVLPAAKAAGLSLRDVGAALATMTDENVPADEAATRLRMTFSLMGAPSKQAQKALEGIGISALDLGHAMQGPQGLIGAIALLKSHLEQIQDPAERFAVLSKAFGGARSASAIMLLVNNFSVLEQKYRQIGDTASQFDQKVLAAESDNLNQLRHDWVALQADLISVAAAITPTLLAIGRDLNIVVQGFSHLPAGAKQLAVVGLAAAALAGPILRVTGMVTKLAGSVIGLGATWKTNTVAMTTETELMAAKTDAGLASIGTTAEATSAKVAGIKAALASIAGMTVGVAIALSFIPQSSKGQSVLDAVGLGALGQLPVVGGLATQSARLGDWLRKAVGMGSVLGNAPPAGAKNLGNADTVMIGSVGYRNMAQAAAQAENIPAALFLSQINQESGFDPNAKSKAGALGIAQFMPGTAKGYGINPLDPKQALPAAAKMMAGLYSKYHSWALALAAYNAGEGTVDKYLAGHGSLPAETQSYIKSIMSASGMVSDMPTPDVVTKPTGGVNQKIIDNLFGGSAAAPKQTAAQKAAAALHQQLKQLDAQATADSERISADLKQHLISPDVAAALQKRVKTIEAEISKAGGKDALPGLRADLAKLKTDLSTQLSLATDAKALARQTAQINTLIKDGIITPDAAAQLEKKAHQLGQAIAHGTKDALPEIKQQLADLKANVQEWTAQATDVKNFQTSIANMKTSVGNQLRQTLGLPEFYSPPGTLEAAREGAARIIKQLSSTLLSPDVRKSLEQQLKSAQTATQNGMNALVSTIQADESKFADAWGRIASAQDNAFNRATTAHLNEMQTALTRALNTMQVTVRGFGEPFLYGGSITQTPAEAQLAQLQAQHAAQQAADQLAGDQAQYAADQASGADAATLAADLKQVNDDLYQQQVTALQAQADLQRTAAQAQLQAAQDAYTQQQNTAMQAYQDQRDLAQQAMDDQVQTIVTGMEQGAIATADGFAQLTKIYQDNGVPLGQAAFVLAGQIYNGLSSGGIQAAIDLITKLQGEITTLAAMTGVQLPSSSGGGGGSSPTSGPSAGNPAGVITFGGSPGSDGGLIMKYAPAHLMADGGDFLVTKPTLFVAGEAGAERATFRPVRRGGSALASDGDGLHIHFHGGTFIGSSPDKVARDLEPHIRAQLIRTSRRNVTSGIS